MWPEAYQLPVCMHYPLRRDTDEIEPATPHFFTPQPVIAQRPRVPAPTLSFFVHALSLHHTTVLALLCVTQMVASCSPPHSDDGTMPSLYGGASRQSWSSHSTHSTGLATPTTPSVAFPAVLPHNVAKDPYSARPIAHKSPASVVHAIHPAPQPQQRLSELSAFAASMFCYLWFDTNQSKPSKLQIQPTDRFLRFMHDVLTTSELSPSAQLITIRRARASLHALGRSLMAQHTKRTARRRTLHKFVTWRLPAGILKCCSRSWNRKSSAMHACD